MEEDKLFFLLSLYAHWQICTKCRHFLFSFWVLLFCCVLYTYIRTHIEQRRMFCMLPLHNFLVFFLSKTMAEREKKKREEVLTIPPGFILEFVVILMISF